MDDFLASTIQSTFSIAVAAFLLVRMESRLSELSSAITRLQAVIEASFRHTGTRNGDAGV